MGIPSTPLQLQHGVGGVGGLRCPRAVVGLGAGDTRAEPRTTARRGRAAWLRIVHRARDTGTQSSLPKVPAA